MANQNKKATLCQRYDDTQLYKESNRADTSPSILEYVTPNLSLPAVIALRHFNDFYQDILANRDMRGVMRAFWEAIISKIIAQNSFLAIFPTIQNDAVDSS